MPVRRKRSYLRGFFITVLAFALVLVIVLFAVESVSSRSDKSRLDMVGDAVRNAALTCYAVEGRYPQSVDYLRDNYGLNYDTGRYIVRYEGFASNIMPEIRVLLRSAE